MDRSTFLLALVLALAQLPGMSARADDGYRPLDDAARAAQRLYVQAGGVLPATPIGALLSADPARPDPAAIAPRLPATADPRVWLAREWMYRGRLTEAEALLAGSGGPAEAERLILRAQLLARTGRHAAAVSALDAAGRLPQPWAAYAEYNRAAALDGAGRSEAALQALNALGQGTATEPEAAALRDRANIALGFRHLDRGDPAAAHSAFGRVRLDSPFSSRALLGLGWVEFRRDSLSRALIPWMELRQRDAADPSVREALLLVPYVQWRVGAYRDAVESYRSAIARLEGELAAVDGLLAGGTLLDGLAAGSDAAPRRLSKLLADGTLDAALETWRHLRTLDARTASLPPVVRTGTAEAMANHRLWLQTRITEALTAERESIGVQRARAHFELARLLDDVAARRQQP